MSDQDSDEEIILAIRRRSRRSVQSTFAGLAALALLGAFAIHHHVVDYGFLEQEHDVIANSLLAMAVAYAATIFVWEWIFDSD